jgi:hypothetical protein
VSDGEWCIFAHRGSFALVGAENFEGSANRSVATVLLSLTT